jgi:hypothetical protein
MALLGSGRRLAGVWGLAAVVTALYVASAVAAPHPALRASKTCRVPHLAGLTLDVARVRAAHAGCKLRVEGAALEQSTVQTVARQSPQRDRRSPTVTVWLNPFCHGTSTYGPEIAEPMVTPGPTELVSGFYLVGGPLARFSTPRCRRPARPPETGTVEVFDAAGALVATQTSKEGRFVQIPLPAGSYTIRGTFPNATENGVHPTRTESVVISSGDTVRQDFFLDVP